MQRIFAPLLALMLLLRSSACASSSSEEGSLFDPFDYSDSEESRERVPLTPKPVRRRVDVNKVTTFNIEGFTRLIVTEKPVVYRLPTVKPQTRATTIKYKKSTTMKKKKTPRKTTTPKRPNCTTKAKPKTTQSLNNKCPQKNSGWFTSWFGNNKRKTKVWKPGILSSIYNIFGWSDDDSPEETFAEPPGYSNWFNALFQEPATTEKPKLPPIVTTTTSTTTVPPTPVKTTTQSWLNSWWEDEDDAANKTKETPKKPSKKSYSGYQLLRTHLDATWKVHEMLQLQDETQSTEVRWWTEPSMNNTCDILVPPDMLSDVKDHLNIMGLEYDVVIWDLQKAIKYENPRLSKKQLKELEQTRGHPMTWRRYHRYEDITRYLEYLQHSKPDIVQLIPMGRSSEGAPLVAVKLSIPADDSPMPKNETSTKKWKLRSKDKPAVWIGAGVHSQEWIAPAVATWVIHSIVEGDRGRGTDYEMLRKADWYIMPVMNPDGYEYSHTVDRLWSKTRSHRTEDEIVYSNWLPWNWGRSGCLGVDPERNWNYHWGEKGSSSDPCSERYAGPQPFSEPETKAVSKFLLENKDIIKVYISMHSYSQMWLVPSTHSKISFSDEGELMEMGKLAAAALQDIHGTRYKVGIASQLLQPATGVSHDWAKGRAGIKYSYSVRLRDASGPYGYLLPGSQIIPTGQEFYEACKAIVDNL